jgi:hypothetical protein
VSTEVRELPYVGWTVTRISLDWQFRLLLDPDDPHDEGAEVVIGAAFEYRAPDGSRHGLQPGPPHRSLTPALDLHGQRVSRFAASADGRLELEFGDGSGLGVLPDERYEAWEVIGPVGLLCGPGGGKPWID